MSQNQPDRKQDVLVNVILDKSGSMASKLNDVIEGFNAYLAGLGEEKKVNYLFSLTLFDTQVVHRDVALPLAQVKKLDTKSYQPGGNTALNDAIGITVRKVDGERPKVDKIVTVIMTDGEENSSREWTHDAVKGLIEQKEKEGSWTFVFLGAGLEAWHQGRSYGVSAANVAQYNAEQYRDVFTAVAAGTNAVSASPRLRSENLFASLSREFLCKAGLRQAEDKS
ncbi:MAG TPA: vWA domain-containing protein [Terriglobales bacterium]|nr:vWA domain-containing protein [Terriglobales bacterium]